MAEKRKIVIPIGGEPATPQFDAEETLLSARPVVPIAPGETKAGVGPRQRIASVPFYKRLPFLALVIVTAISIGMAAGLNIARYRYQQRNSAPVAAQPAQAPEETRTATVQTPKESSPAQIQQPTEVKADETATGDKTKSDESAKPAEKTAKTSTDASADKTADNKQTDDSEKTAEATAARDKKRTSDDAEADNTARAQRTRDRRQRNRNDDDDVFNVPRRIEKTGEQINRIREIFEGRP